MNNEPPIGATVLAWFPAAGVEAIATLESIDDGIATVRVGNDLFTLPVENVRDADAD
jgi:hypothetical protein